MSSDESQKIGAGHPKAMWELGLSELRAGFYPGSNIAQPSNYGIYGTPTPGEIADARRPRDWGLEHEHDSISGEELDQELDLDGPDDPGLDME